MIKTSCIKAWTERDEVKLLQAGGRRVLSHFDEGHERVAKYIKAEDSEGKPKRYF